MSRDRQIAVLASIVGLAGLIIGIVALSQDSGADDEWVRNRALPGDSAATSAAAPASESDEREIRELSDRLERLEERQVAESQAATDDSSDETAEDRESASTDRDDSDLGAAQSAAPEETDDRDGLVLEYDEEDSAGNAAEQETFEMELDEETTASATTTLPPTTTALAATTLPPTTTPPTTTTAPPTDGAANSSGGKKWKVKQDCNGDGIYSWSDVEDINIDDCEYYDIDTINLWDGSYDPSCSSFWGSHQYGCVTTPYSANGGADYPGVPGSNVMPAYIDTATWFLKPKLHLPNGKVTGHLAMAYVHSHFEVEVWCNPNEPIIPQITVSAASKFPSSQAYEAIPFKIKVGDNNNNEWTTIWSPIGLDLPIQSNNTFWITGSHNQFTYQVNVTARQDPYEGAFGTRYGCKVDTIVIGSDQLETFTDVPGENMYP